MERALDSVAARGEGAVLPRARARGDWIFCADAKTTLRLLNVLAGSRDVAPAFLTPKVAPKAAYAAVHFLEVLLGPKAEAPASVKDPKPRGRRGKARERGGRVCRAAPLSSSRAGGGDTRTTRGRTSGRSPPRSRRSADYDGATLDRARDLLVRRTIGAAFVPPVLRDVVDACAALRARGARRRRFRADEEKKNALPGITGARSRGTLGLARLAGRVLGPDPHEGRVRGCFGVRSAFSRLTFGRAHGTSGALCGFFPPFLAQSASTTRRARPGPETREAARARVRRRRGERLAPRALGSSIFL